MTCHVGQTLGPALAINIARYTKSFVPGEGTMPFPSAPDGQVDSTWLKEYRGLLGDNSEEAVALARASAYGLDGPEPENHGVGPVTRVSVRALVPRLWHDCEGTVTVATLGRVGRFPSTVCVWLADLADLPLGADVEVPPGQDMAALARFLVNGGGFAAA